MKTLHPKYPAKPNRMKTLRNSPPGEGYPFPTSLPRDHHPGYTYPMVRKSAVLFAALLALAVSAHAQFAVYGTATVERISDINNLAPTITGTSYDKSVNPLGFAGGVFYDFRTLGPVRIGVDLRGSKLTTRRGDVTGYEGTGAHLYSGLGGIRAQFHTPIHILLPYVEGMAGIGRSDYGLSYRLSNNLEYHAYAGLDLRISPLLDLRVAELGYGGLHAGGGNIVNSAGATTGAMKSGNLPLESVSAGIVIHIPYRN